MSGWPRVDADLKWAIEGARNGSGNGDACFCHLSGSAETDDRSEAGGVSVGTNRGMDCRGDEMLRSSETTRSACVCHV